MFGRQQPPPALPDDCHSFHFQVCYIRPPSPIKKDHFEVGISANAVKGASSGLKLLRKQAGLMTKTKAGKGRGETEPLKLLVAQGRFKGKYDKAEALFRLIQAAVASYDPQKPFNLFDVNLLCFVGLSRDIQKDTVDRILREDNLAAEGTHAKPVAKSSLVDKASTQDEIESKAAAAEKPNQDLIHPRPRRTDKSLPTIPSVLDSAPASSAPCQSVSQSEPPQTQDQSPNEPPSAVKAVRTDPRVELSPEALAATEMMEEWIEAQMHQRRYYFVIRIHGYGGSNQVRSFCTAQPLPSEADVRMWAMTRWGKELLDRAKWRLTMKGGGDFIEWRSQQLNSLPSPSDASGQDTPQVYLSFIPVNPKLVVYNQSPAGMNSSLSSLQPPSGMNTPGLYSVPPSYRNTPQTTPGHGPMALPKVERSPSGTGLAGAVQPVEPGHMQLRQPVREVPGGWAPTEHGKDYNHNSAEDPASGRGSSNASQSPKRSSIDAMSSSNSTLNSRNSDARTPASQRSPRTPGSHLPAGPVMNTAAFVEVGMRLARADPTLFSELMTGTSTSDSGLGMRRGRGEDVGLGVYCEPGIQRDEGVECARPTRSRAMPSPSYGPGPAVPDLHPSFLRPVPPRPDLPDYVWQTYPSSEDSPHAPYTDLPSNTPQHPYPMPWPPMGSRGQQQGAAGLQRSAMSSGALPDLMERDEEGSGAPVQRSLSAGRSGTR